MKIRQFEEMSMNAWPSLQTRLFDGWVLRFAAGFTKRANCVNPLYASTLPLNEKIDHCEGQYRMHGLPAVFKITPESIPGEIDATLAERGYVRGDEVSLRTLPMNRYVRSEPRDITAEPGFSEKWLEGVFRCSDFTSKKDQVIIRRILDNILGGVICVTKSANDKVVGCGYGAVERDYIGVFNVIVDKEFRGKGYGRDIMDGILGAALDVKAAYPQVLAGNSPAEKLYDRLGFQELYRYWYRKPGA